MPNPEDVTITAPKVTGVAAIVNDVVISDYDLDQRVALFVATSGLKPSPETLAQARGQVLRALEDEVLELQEAQKHKIAISKAEVDRALQNIADDNHVPLEQILNSIKQAGVPPETLRQQIAAQLTWQRLVAARYGTDIFVSDQQIEDAMNRLKQGSDKPQFDVSEIFLAVDKPDEENAVKTSAEQIVAQLGQGAAFPTVAGQFSQSPSAADGGDIGWVVQGQLAEELDTALGTMHPGETSKPIRSEGGYYVLMLRDRREPAGTKVETPAAAAALDPASVVPLDRLLIPLPAGADDMLKQRAMALANTLRTQVKSCAELPAVSKQLDGTVYSRLGNLAAKDLAPDLRDGLLKTGPGEMVAPYFSPAGLELIMRCDPAPPKLVAFQLPSRDDLQQELFVQQMAIYARSYLRDLRRDSVVETR